MRRALIAVVLLAGISAPAHAKDRVLYKPAGPWAMEYANESCRLIRNFTDGQRTITAAFERLAPGIALRLGLAGNALSTWRGEKEVAFRYDPGGEPRTSSLQRTVLADGRNSFLIASASLPMPIAPAKPGDEPSVAPGVQSKVEDEDTLASRITSIVITDGFHDEQEIQFGSLAKPIAAMRACVDDLVKSWGIDPRQLETSSRRPEPSNAPQTWITNNDYPTSMLVANRQGIVGFRLIIGQDGTVERCRVDIEKPGAFEEATCKAVLKRAKFNPGLDAEGKPMRSYWMSRVHFALPN